MNKHIHFMKKVLIILTFLLVNTAFGQQYSLFGHFQDFSGYYNPALNKGGKYTEVGVIHRSQWSDFGSPTISTLFFKFPPNLDLSILDFRSVGVVVQHEDYDFLTMNSFQLYTSNTLVKNRNYTLAGGITLGMRINSLNVSELSANELADPELGSIDGTASFTNRVGLSFETKKLQVGVASGLNEINTLSDLTASAKRMIDVDRTKFKIIPSVVYRLSSSYKSQLEIQARAVYDKKVAFTVGYRKDYGPLIQLGMVINKVKGSYSAELPAGDKSPMGVTHEFLLTYNFEILNKEKKKEDSLFQQRRDSIKTLRLEKLRQKRLAMYQKEPEATEDSTLLETEDAGITRDPLNDDEIMEFEYIAKNEIKDNMHVIMRHINFETNYDILKPYAFDELDKLVHFLKSHKHFNIEIQGHTDDVGTNDDNDELSYRRALAVFNYLVSRGIDSGRMTIVGYGEEKPLYPNDSAEHRRLNRRIEVVFSTSE